MNARQAKALPRCSAVCTTTRRRASYRASRGDVSSHGYCVLATHMHSLLQLGALGAGGTGTVELMRHRDSGELVAVRFIERGPKVLLSRPRVPRRLPSHARGTAWRPNPPVPAWPAAKQLAGNNRGARYCDQTHA